MLNPPHYCIFNLTPKKLHGCLLYEIRVSRLSVWQEHLWANGQTNTFDGVASIFSLYWHYYLNTFLPYISLLSNNPSHNPFLEHAIADIKVCMISESLNFHWQPKTAKLLFWLGLVHFGGGHRSHLHTSHWIVSSIHPLPAVKYSVCLWQKGIKQSCNGQKSSLLYPYPAADICQWLSSWKWQPRPRQKWTGPSGFCPHIPDGLSQHRQINIIIIPTHFD